MQPDPYLLPATMTIKSIEAICADLLPRLEQDDELILRAQEIERVDGIGLQLLCYLLARSSQARPVSIESPSDTLLKAARIYGLDLPSNESDANGGVGE